MSWQLGEQVKPPALSRSELEQPELRGSSAPHLPGEVGAGGRARLLWGTAQLVTHKMIFTLDENEVI